MVTSGRGLVAAGPGDIRAYASQRTGSRQAVSFALVRRWQYRHSTISRPAVSPLMRLRIVFALLVAATNFACDPCAGVARCSAGDYLSATGQVVERGTGRGV